MNILVSINKEELYKSLVMLVSLLENNKNVKLYIYTDEINAVSSAIDEIIYKYGVYRRFFCCEDLKGINCVISSIKQLSENVKRILYLSSDSMICGDLEDFYYQDFDNGAMVVRGQSAISENHHRSGARPEKGQFFDARVLLINVEWFRRHDVSVDETLSFQGQLNVALKNNVKYEPAVVYNIRHSIIRELEENGISIPDDFIIVCFEKRDYFFCEIEFMPWNVCFDEDMERTIHELCDMFVPYDNQLSYLKSYVLFRLWHEYSLKIKERGKLRVSEYNRKELKQEIAARCGVDRYKNILSLFKMINLGQKVSSEKLQKVRYYELIRYVDTLSPNEAKNIMNNLFVCNMEHLKKKDVLNVAFVVCSSAEWQCELLYRNLEKEQHYSPTIFIIKQVIDNDDVTEQIYNQTCAFFEKKYNVIRLEQRECEIEDELNKMDIIFYFSKYNIKPQYMNAQYQSLNKLIGHIPYAYYLQDKDDVRYGNTYYDDIFFKLLWKFFVPCKKDIKYIAQRQRMHGFNVYFSGFPKMDELISGQYIYRDNIWKGSEKNLKLLWAPHFNMEKGMNGTFNVNYKWFLYYAKSHSEVSWVVRPHPMFAAGAIKAGVFDSIKDVEDYWTEWNELENAKVIEYGGYYDIFDSSDAMILDSSSFLAEYLFVHKPQLYLLSSEPRGFGGIGNDIIKIVRKVKADDYDGIESFIEDCKNNCDLYKDDREMLFNKEINYYEINGMLATEYIMNVLKF